MNTKQIKERINRMMQEETVTPAQAVGLMASVMSLIEVRALADDLTVAVVDKALSEIGEGKLPAEKAVELFDELRAMAEKDEAAKSRTQEQDEASSKKKTYTGEYLGGMFRDVTGEALEYARDQIEIAREKMDKQGEKIRRKIKEKGVGKVDGDVVQEHYTANAFSSITGDLRTKTTAVQGVLTLGGDLQAPDNLNVSGKLDCDGDIISGETHIYGTGSCGGDMRSGDISVLGRLHCDGDMRFGDISVRGAVDCAGDTEGEDFSISGKYKCGGDLQGKDLQASGVLICGGDLHGQELVVTGKTEIGGDVNAHKIKVSGRLKSGGDLKGNTVYVSGRMLSDGDMRFDTLTVEEPHEWVEWLTGGLIKDVDQIVCRGDLVVNGEVQSRGRIIVDGRARVEEGFIEHIRAKSVTLGPGVRVRHVEYGDELVLADGAEVEDPVQIS